MSVQSAEQLGFRPDASIRELLKAGALIGDIAILCSTVVVEELPTSNAVDSTDSNSSVAILRVKPVTITPGGKVEVVESVPELDTGLQLLQRSATADRLAKNAELTDWMRKTPYEIALASGPTPNNRFYKDAKFWIEHAS